MEQKPKQVFYSEPAQTNQRNYKQFPVVS